MKESGREKCQYDIVFEHAITRGNRNLSKNGRQIATPAIFTGQFEPSVDGALTGHSRSIPHLHRGHTPLAQQHNFTDGLV